MLNCAREQNYAYCPNSQASEHDSSFDESIPPVALVPTLTGVCLFLHIDNGPAGSRRTGTATVFVEVQDVNDNRPIFLQNSYETSILESVPRGTSILQVESTRILLNTSSNKTTLSAIKLKTSLYFLT